MVVQIFEIIIWTGGMFLMGVQLSCDRPFPAHLAVEAMTMEELNVILVIATRAHTHFVAITTIANLHENILQIQVYHIAHCTKFPLVRVCGVCMCMCAVFPTINPFMLIEFSLVIMFHARVGT